MTNDGQKFLKVTSILMIIGGISAVLVSLAGFAGVVVLASAADAHAEMLALYVGLGLGILAAAEAAETASAQRRREAAGSAGKRNCRQRATASWAAASSAAKRQNCGRSRRKWEPWSWKAFFSGNRSA